MTGEMKTNNDRQGSLTEKAYQEIKEWIIHFDLKPETHLKITELSAKLKMSQTPVREALSKLEQDAFVYRHPKQGYVVRSLNLKEVEDIYDVRLALEVVAAEEAAARMTESDQEKLSRILEEVANLIQIGDKGKILKLEQDFHVVIMEASGNRFLCEIGKGILERIWMIQNVNILTSDHLLIAHQEHDQIFKALKQGGPQTAADLMKKHLQFAKQYIISRLKNSDDFLSKFIMGSYSDKRLG